MTLDGKSVLLISVKPGRDGQPCRELLAIDEALRELAEHDPRKAQIVEMRFFGGLTLDEIADVLEVAPITVSREWAKARAWLLRGPWVKEDCPIRR